MEPQKNLEAPRAFETQSNSMQNPHEVGNFGFEQQGLQIDKQKALEDAMRTYENQPPQNSTVASQVQLPTVQVDVSHQPVISNSAPATAKDIDLMEDEWVKDLKQMVLATKGNPYMREIRFKEMQIDYLKKRYNRIINGGK